MCLCVSTCVHARMLACMYVGVRPESQLNGCWEEAAGQDGHGIGICFAQSALGIKEPSQESPVGQNQQVQWEYLE